MEKALILGKMVENMKESTSMIKNMVLEFINGQMEESMKGFGNTENRQENRNIYFQMEVLCMEFGKMVRELNGLKKRNIWLISRSKIGNFILTKQIKIN